MSIWQTPNYRPSPYAAERRELDAALVALLEAVRFGGGRDAFPGLMGRVRAAMEGLEGVAGIDGAAQPRAEDR